MNEDIDLTLTPEQIRQLPPLERTPYIGQFQVIYPRFEDILERIRTCYKDRANSADPQCLLIVGPPGVGKTTLLEIILGEHPRVVTDTRTFIPALYSYVRAPANAGLFISALLKDIRDPRYMSGSPAARLLRLEEFTEDCKIKMWLSDEIQHILDRQNKRILRDVTDLIKNFIKAYRIVCIMTGLEGEAEQIIDDNPQLAALFPDPIVLAPFTWDETKPDTVKEWRTLLDELEDLLPLNGESHLSYENLAWRLHVATDGVMRPLINLIRDATNQALVQGYESLDDILLAASFDKLLAGERRGIANPFFGAPPPYLSPDARKKKSSGKKNSQ